MEANKTRLFCLLILLQAVLAQPALAAASLEKCMETADRFRAIGNVSQMMSEAYGYAILPTIGKGGLGIREGGLSHVPGRLGLIELGLGDGVLLVERCVASEIGVGAFEVGTGRVEGDTKVTRVDAGDGTAPRPVAAPAPGRRWTSPSGPSRWAVAHVVGGCGPVRCSHVVRWRRPRTRPCRGSAPGPPPGSRWRS